MPGAKPTSREATVCLVLVAAWTLVTLWQALTVDPWDQGAVYFRATYVISGAYLRAAP